MDNTLVYVLQGIILFAITFGFSAIISLGIIFYRKDILQAIETEAIFYAAIEVLANGKRKEFLEVYEKKKSLLMTEKQFTRK